MRLYSSFAKVIKISELGIYIDFSVFFFKQERLVNSPEDLEDEAIVEGLMQLMHVFWSCVMMKTAVTNILVYFCGLIWFLHQVLLPFVSNSSSFTFMSKNSG